MSASPSSSPLPSSSASSPAGSPPAHPAKGRVKLLLQRRSDSDLLGFATAHVGAITDNPDFPAPQPDPEVFDSKLAELKQVVAELENQRLACLALTQRRDRLRAEFEGLFQQRGTYVQLTSSGSTQLIASAGLPVRSRNSRIGRLPHPLALRVELNGEEGLMLLRWEPVPGARAYLLEYAEVIDNVATGWTLKKVTGRTRQRLKGMLIGKTYAFRVAAVGGEDGSSPWSPEVWRTAA